MGSVFCFNRSIVRRTVRSVSQRLILGFLLASTSVFAKTGPSSHLESLGFTLLQGAPIDFELSDLNGTSHRLESYRGKWILLAFWASWCGPCNMEIPALDELFRKYGNQGLTVVGISVDSDKSAAESFVRDKKISIPILHDPKSSVSSQYRASALPTLYVISPDWKLVGVMQGARDWTSDEASKTVAQLVKFHEYKETDVGIKMVKEDDGLSMPNDLAPPQLDLSLDKTDWKIGQSGQVTVSVTWKSDPKNYLIRTPKLTIPEGVILGEASSSSTSDADSTTLQYHFPIQFKKEGNQKLGPVELGFSPRSGGKELFSRNEGISVEVSTSNIAGIVASSLLGIAALAGLTVFVVRRPRKPSRVAPTASKDWREPFEKVRQLKMKGQKNEYMAALLNLNLEIDEASGVKNPTVRSLLEKLRFGGLSLSETELTSFEKKIERAIKESP